MKKIIFILSAFLLLASCKEIQFADGRIPAEYLEQAQKFAGTYQGQFEGEKGSLTIAFNGDRPEVSFSSGRGHRDLLGGECDSMIGQIVSAEVSSKKNIKFVTFAFDPGACSKIQGRHLYLLTDKLASKGMIKVQVLDHIDEMTTIGDCSKFGCGIEVIERRVYLEGSFQK